MKEAEMESKSQWISRPHRIGLVVTGAALVVCLLGSGALLAEKDSGQEQLGTTREALRKWVDTRKTISRTKHDLDETVQMLKERIGVVRGEVQSLKRKTEESRSVIAEQEKKRDELKARLETLAGAADSLKPTIETLENRTVALLDRLPAHVREDRMISTLSKTFRGDPNDPNGVKKGSLSQRFQNVVGVLNKLNELSREIKVLPQRVLLPDGREAEVQAVFLGFGQAYYLGGRGKTAGIGRLSDDGKWTWVPANESAEEIARVMAILEDEKPAAFVQVPIEIK
ncbi:MAG: DUF3450 family protein [Phycisphaerae bacterium]